MNSVEGHEVLASSLRIMELLLSVNTILDMIAAWFEEHDLPALLGMIKSDVGLVTEISRLLKEQFHIRSIAYSPLHRIYSMRDSALFPKTPRYI